MKDRNIALLAIGLIAFIGFAVYSGWISLPSIGPPGADVNALSYSYDGLADAASDIVWNLFTTDGQFLETQTSSSGKCTWGTMLTAGSKVILQARANDPSDGVDPYLSPPIEVTVKQGESADTVSLGSHYVYDVSTAVTLAVKDQGGAAISDNSANYFNTTDTSMIWMLTGCVSDDVFGLGGVIKDWKTGNYYGGMYLVWKGTAVQNFGADYTLDDPTNIYYIWRVDRIVNDADDPNDGFATYQFGVTTGTMGADATVVLDVADFAKCDASGKPYIASLYSSDVDVTAITTKVA